jgi:tetratricopeptide (TPR) repeat protein
MDVNNPLFETNYHDVDYQILGLDQYFFAQLLTELSSFAAAGAPLEKAYREDILPSQKATQTKIIPKKSIKTTVERPEPEIELTEINDSSIINKHKSFSESKEEIPSIEDISQSKPITIPSMNSIEVGAIIKPEVLAPPQQKIKVIEQLITEGKTAFYINDSFTAIEKYNTALDSLEKMGPEFSEKMLDIYSDVIESCINTQHDNIAIDFAEKMKEKAESVGDMFQMGNADYFKGICLIHKNNPNEGLKFIQNAAILFENSGDYAGVGKSNEDIGDIYFKNNDIESAALFFKEAMKNYSNAIKRFHKKRRSSWALPVNLKIQIKKLKEKVNAMVDKIASEQVKAKLKNDMKNIN